ncbi:tether containing ubx domain for glut4 [Anaeramoeba flamelloides]|uniref:Tether containing ubx domain for glut4 n=1 Tax=Anaeramoeba flamelloides TaxID=1746091 RepID=A0ABQ8YBH8_9EUKA|nr:tether containing ubx domain for glut4 [Anaeramoeba flamelloides]
MSFRISVQILSSKRETLFIKSSTTLQEILNIVCSKNNLQGSYKLKYKNKILGLALPFLKSGVPNHGTVQLVKDSTSTGKIRVIIQIDHKEKETNKEKENEKEKGKENEKEKEKKKEKFIFGVRSTCSLWTLLRGTDKKRKKQGKNSLFSHINEESNENDLIRFPIFICGMKKFDNENLMKNTTLKSLGITSGSAIFRIYFEQKERNKYYLSQSLETETNQNKKKKGNDKNSSSFDVSQEKKKSFLEMVEDLKEKEKENDQKREMAKKKQQTRIDQLKKKEMPKILKQYEEEEKRKKMEQEMKQQIEKKKQEKMMHFILKKQRENNFYKSSISRTVNKELKEKEREAQLKKMNQNYLDERHNKKQINDKMKKVYLQKETNVKLQQKQESQINRNIVIFPAPKTRQAKPSDMQLPKGFFKLSKKDLKYRMDQQRKNIEFMSTLMTRELRDKKRKKFHTKTVVIRYVFPDRISIQATFLPNEKVLDLYKLLREQFVSSKKKLPIKLFIAPPKMDLIDMDKTLVKSNLSPKSLVYVSLMGNDIPTPEIIKSHLCEELQNNVKIMENMEEEGEEEEGDYEEENGEEESYSEDEKGTEDEEEEEEKEKEKGDEKERENENENEIIVNTNEQQEQQTNNMNKNKDVDKYLKSLIRF